MRCSTRSGRYQCSRGEEGHGGECETDDLPFSPRLGPFMDRDRALAYLRGRLDAAAGSGLDFIGRATGTGRATAEVDSNYRERIWSAAS